MAPRGSTPVEITAVPLRFSNTVGWPSGEFTVAPQDGGSGWCLEGDKACTSPWHLAWGRGGWGEGGGGGCSGKANRDHTNQAKKKGLTEFL